ncbi:CoF synthetase [Cohnella suwonensis]|uniref:CoF synthetase n=1 Tax=Cohnella suwonensis TaxID=696072 RepID=A0ABW0LQ64_9BACL
MAHDRLRRKIERMIDVFPWYGAWLAESGVDPAGDVALERLPLLTAETLERRYYGGEPPSFATQSGVGSYRTSGTSTGRRKTIYYSEEDEIRYVRIKAELFGKLLGPTGARTALSDMGTGHAAATALDVFAGAGIAAESISFEKPVGEHLAKLASLRPDVLYTMPSIVDRLLAASPGDPAAYGVRHVLLVGEIASPAWRAGVAARLGLAPEHVTDTLGSIEIGTIAYYSHEHGRYFFVEGIEAEGVPASALSAGESSRMPEEDDPPHRQDQVLVLTSYARDLFPALRYVTYDLVRDLRPVLVDGHWAMSFEAIVGRIGPELKHGEKISLYDIEEVVYRHLPEANVRVRVGGNKLTIQVDDAERDPQVYAAIEADLADRIPDIGIMIRGGLLDALRVVPADISFEGTALKHKKIHYDREATER